MQFFSIIIPLYNRPQEIAELLESLTKQNYRRFEVIVVEDGSELDARDIVESYRDRLDVQYLFIPNGGQGFARNKGFSLAKGSYFIVFDSDCIIPPQYLQEVDDFLIRQPLDAFGGPDAAHASFSDWQKAISYAMTSPLTTGGIRGNKKHLGVFHPRSFNMGISREVWERTGGFRWANKSEDMEFSMRMRAEGFQVGLIPNAYVYHKRRSTWRQFFKQTYSFGEGRIRLYRVFPSELKWVHALPAMFLLACVGWLLTLFMAGLSRQLHLSSTSLWTCLAVLGSALLMFALMVLFSHALVRTKRLRVALLAVPAALCQLIAYGAGFLQALCFATEERN